MKILILLLSCVTILAQSQPPSVVTNIVKLNQFTKLIWNQNSEPDIHGYWAEMRQGTNVWKSYTTTNFIPIININSNAVSGNYVFTVVAVNTSGLEGNKSVPLTTNLVSLPSVVINVRLEVILQ